MKTQSSLLVACLLITACVSTPRSSSVKFRSVGSGKVVEDCFVLGKGQIFVYSFESNRDVDFNIYYKFNQEVVFPVDAPKSRNVRGKFKAPVRENYCLMWTNEQDGEAEVTWTLLSDA